MKCFPILFSLCIWFPVPVAIDLIYLKKKIFVWYFCNIHFSTVTLIVGHRRGFIPGMLYLGMCVYITLIQSLTDVYFFGLIQLCGSAHSLDAPSVGTFDIIVNNMTPSENRDCDWCRCPLICENSNYLLWLIANKTGNWKEMSLMSFDVMG